MNSDLTLKEPSSTLILPWMFYRSLSLELSKSGVKQDARYLGSFEYFLTKGSMLDSNMLFLSHQITDLLDVVLDSFIKTSATGGLGSIKAEVMADTAVALASGNVKLVSSKVSTFSEPHGLCHSISVYHLESFCPITS